jgi:hypothetical protein
MLCRLKKSPPAVAAGIIEPSQRYKLLACQLGEDRTAHTLPVARPGEVPIWHIPQSNGKAVGMMALMKMRLVLGNAYSHSNQSANKQDD